MPEIPLVTNIFIDPKFLKDLKIFTEYVIVKVIRPQDMLSLELWYYNFDVNYNTNELIRRPGDAYLKVLFEPQSIGEQCGTETLNANGKDIDRQMPPIPARALLADKSRLVFTIPETVGTIPLVTDELLNWKGFTLKVNSRARKFDIRRPKRVFLNLPEPLSAPDKMETSIEIPIKLFLSPTSGAVWMHSIKMKADKGLINPAAQLTELWHTRLANTTNPVDEMQKWAAAKTVRAIWATDAKPGYADYGTRPSPKPGVPNDPFLQLSSINAKQRHSIVHESSNFGIAGYPPQSIDVKKLFLTALGGWLDSLFVANGTLPNGLSVQKWRHIQTLAREHYVEVVEAGYILPFGHKASLVTITERKPQMGNNTSTATLFRRKIIVIAEPVKTYQYRYNTTFLQFPFSKVEIITTATPLLDLDDSNEGKSFIIKSGKAPVLFQMQAVDLWKNTIDFKLPLSFVSKEATDANPDGIVAGYTTQWVAIAHQKMIFAPYNANACNTLYETSSLTFKVIRAVENGSKVPIPNEPQGFLPVVQQAEIIEPAYRRLTGNNVALTITLSDVEFTESNKENKGRVFAVVQYPQSVSFGGQSDKSGGFATPDFAINGLSEITGPFGGAVEAFKNGQPVVKDYFQPDAKLFGVLKFSDLFEFTGIDKSIPQLTTSETGGAFITSYQFKPAFKVAPVTDKINISINSLVALQFSDQEADKLSINTNVITPKDGTRPSFSCLTSICNFSVQILPVDDDGLLNISFNKISFTAGSDSKADVSVEMKDKSIRFGGPLAFLNGFTELIDADGFSDPPYLDVSTTGIKSGYTLELPNLQMGAFSLSHLSLGAEVNLPFTGSPLTVGFRFCERHQPFTLTVGPLGGGGFFGIVSTLQGLQTIEAAIEFGAAVALNLGTASGAVSIMGGIYFKAVFQKNPEAINTQLTGYVRINGAMRIIGLITASLEFYMDLSYFPNIKKAEGHATLMVKVEVLFFSKSVSVPVKRTFAGSGSDPNFEKMIAKQEWLDYCSAFAA